MSKETAAEQEIELQLLCDYYAQLERQGPGSPEITVKALGFVEGLHNDSHIADIGCGTGGQTMVLAQHAPGRITGVDHFERFIDLFNGNAEAAGLRDRMKGVVGSMEALPFGDGELDLIWSEGAIYNIGFERGLREWRRCLRPAGYIAVSEISWLTDNRPAEIDAFWNAEYAGIDTIAAKVAVMQASGYIPVAAFVLPESCWTDHFYAPQQKVMGRFSAAHAGSRAAEELVAAQRHEQALYMKYRAFYGYVFYIGKRVQ